MALSMIAFVVISLLAFLVALLLFDGVACPFVIGVFCDFAAATVLNVTDILARGSRRDRTAAMVIPADTTVNGRTAACANLTTEVGA